MDKKKIRGRGLNHYSKFKPGDWITDGWRIHQILELSTSDRQDTYYVGNGHMLGQRYADKAYRLLTLEEKAHLI